jgi:hypothetical protein
MPQESEKKREGIVSRAAFRAHFGLEYTGYVNAFAERWGFNLEEGGDVDVLKALSAVIAAYERDVNGNSKLKDEKTRAEIEKLSHHNAAKKIENETLAGQRVDFAKLMPMLQRHAGDLRGAGDLVARKSNLSGQECQAIINTVVDSLERDIERTFGGGATGK